MKNRDTLVANWKNAMLPLSFTFSSLLNFGFYYLGLAFQENPAREYGFIIGSIILAVLSGLTFLYALCKEHFRWYTWCLLCAIGLFYIGSFVIGLLRFGANGLFISYIQKFIVFCLPALFAGICAAKWRTDLAFIPFLEAQSFFAIPAALQYINQILFNCNPFNWGHDLGIIHYMSFAYTLMPLLVAHMIQFADGADLMVPFIKKKVPHPQIMRAILILIYWIDIYASGTRGATICVLCFGILLVLYKLLHRESAKRAGAIFCAMLLIFLFNLCVYAPAGMHWLQRMDMFVEGLEEGKLITSVEDPSVAAHVDDLVAADPDNIPGTSTDPGTSTEPSENVPQIKSRGTIFKLAFKEFLKSPLTGMGPGGFSEKYKMFPHNVILELLAETGLAGTIPVLCLILFMVWKLLIGGWKDRHAQYFLLFIMAYAVQANINGTFWNCSALLCALGYGIVYTVPEKQSWQDSGNKSSGKISV